MRRPRNRFAPSVQALEDRTPLSTSAIMTPLDAPSSSTFASPNLDTTRFASDRAKISAQDYPSLGQDYEVLAPSSNRYNCLAYVLGVRNRWITPRVGSKANPFSWLDRELGRAGFTRQPGVDTTVEPGEQKVAVYAYTNGPGSLMRIMHVALQSSDGTWTSKLAEGPLIRHPTAESLIGPAFGTVVAAYARKA